MYTIQYNDILSYNRIHGCRDEYSPPVTYLSFRIGDI